MKKVLVLAISLFAINIYADQCSIVTDQQARGAEFVLKKGDSLINYCEPCQDPMFGYITEPESLTIKTIEIKKVGEDENEVLINGESYDLAYLFKHKYDNVYLNVSKMVRCPSFEVTDIKVFE